MKMLPSNAGPLAPSETIAVGIEDDLAALDKLPLPLREAIRYSPDKCSAEQLLREFHKGKALRPDLPEEAILEVYCKALLQGVPERDKSPSK